MSCRAHSLVRSWETQLQAEICKLVVRFSRHNRSEGSMTAYDEAIARGFRTAQLNRRRYLRLEQELDHVITRPPERLAQILLACRAAAEIEYRRAARVLYNYWDIDTTKVLAAIEGRKMDYEMRRG